MLVSGDNNELFNLFRHRNVYCGHSLESPRRGDSNEYPHYIILWITIKQIDCLLPNTHIICFTMFYYERNLKSKRIILGGTYFRRLIIIYY